MKKMITAVAAMLITAATFAQTGQEGPPPSNGAAATHRAPMTPEQRAKKETDNINSLIALGGAYDKVLAVNTDFINKRMAIKGGEKRGETPTDEQKAQMKALNEDHNKQLEAAMGKDLYTKWKAAERAKREERREQRQQSEQGPPRDK